MRILIAVVSSLGMAFVGLLLGSLLDSYFGGVTWSFMPFIAIVFAIITMGSFIIKSIENNKRK